MVHMGVENFLSYCGILKRAQKAEVMDMPFYGYGLGYYGEDIYYFIATLVVLAIGLIAQASMRGTFNKYAKQPASAGLSAEQLARELLHREGSAVAVTQVGGALTDHFNPKTQIVGLSDTVYSSSSIAALAVAAHEIGHVMQYEQDYAPIRIRNAILPVASFGSQAGPFIVIMGLIFANANIALAGVFLFGAAFIFQLITLPVEFNASRRAMEMLESGGYLAYDEATKARRVLRAAAMTYVIAALASLVTLLRYLALARRSRR